MLRADFHAHTSASPDAWTTPAQLVERAAEAGLDRIAVTDHGEIEGALEAHALDPVRVIVGEEITTRCGTDLIGLFLRERVPQRLPLADVAERIRAQGGVVYAPHPFAYVCGALAHAARAIQVSDVVEGTNSRAFWPEWNRLAGEEARRRGLPLVAGSDAHFPWEIGRAYTTIPPFGNARELLAALPLAVPVAVFAGSPMIHLASLGLALARVLLDPRWLAQRARARGVARVDSLSAPDRTPTA